MYKKLPCYGVDVKIIAVKIFLLEVLKKYKKINLNQLK